MNLLRLNLVNGTAQDWDESVNLDKLFMGSSFSITSRLSDGEIGIATNSVATTVRQSLPIAVVEGATNVGHKMNGLLDHFGWVGTPFSIN